ncbi:outer membrane protein [Actinobacillus equuli]|nr:outer membrane protein [Actinobacillus equuli]
MTAKLNYEQALTSALNEIDTHYYAYEQARSSYATLQKAYEHDKRISTYYKIVMNKVHQNSVSGLVQ